MGSFTAQADLISITYLFWVFTEAILKSTLQTLFLYTSIVHSCEPWKLTWRSFTIQQPHKRWFYHRYVRTRIHKTITCELTAILACHFDWDILKQHLTRANLSCIGACGSSAVIRYQVLFDNFTVLSYNLLVYPLSGFNKVQQSVKWLTTTLYLAPNWRLAVTWVMFSWIYTTDKLTKSSLSLGYSDLNTSQLYSVGGWSHIGQDSGFAVVVV